MKSALQVRCQKHCNHLIRCVTYFYRFPADFYRGHLAGIGNDGPYNDGNYKTLRSNAA